MRKISFVFFIFALFISASAQTAKVKIQKAGSGKISVVRGKVRSVIDLSQDVAGCAFISGAAKTRLDKIGCTASPATFQMVDATEKNKQTFLILTADAQENCNVCGQCGASEASTLLWLKLDARLRVLEKKNVPLYFCRENISLISPMSDEDEKTGNETWNLPFKNDVLTIEFEKRIFGDSDKDIFEYTRIEYNRTKPEKGFVIKTEKRDKSSVSEQ